MDNALFLKGKKVILRPLNKSDLTAEYLGWLNDPEVSQYLISTALPTNMDQLVKFYEHVTSSKTDVMLAIIRLDTRKHIGNIKLGSINWVHRFADLGILIGDQKSWGKGYGQESCKLLVDYAFEILNLNKVFLGVYADHAAAVKAYEKVGFKVEGRLKKMLFNDGKFHDQLIMGINKK